MKLQNNFITYLLLALFTLVIIFPGYSNSLPKKKQLCTIAKQLEKAPVIGIILKKCLASGVGNTGPVQEERCSTSEEESSHTDSGNAGYIMPLSPVAGVAASVPVAYVEWQQEHHSVAGEILSPPPNSI